MVPFNRSLNNSTETNVNEENAILYLRLGICVLIMLLTTLGNFLVCFAVLIYKNLQTRTNMMLFSLAVSDLLMVVSMAFNTTIILYGEWRFNSTICTVVSSLALTLCFISILHLCLLSIDRYISVRKPFKHPQLMSRRIIMALIVAIWIVPSIVVNLPHADFDFRSSVFGCLKNASHHNPSSSVVLVLLFVILPFAVLFYVYIYLFKVVHQHARRITDVQLQRNNSQPETSNNRWFFLRQDVKSIKTFALVIGVFLLCYTPFFVLGTYVSSKGTGTISVDVMSAVVWLAFCNSFCNPVVYSLRYKKFRESFRKILCSPQAIVTSRRSDSISQIASVGRTNVLPDVAPFVIRSQALPNSGLT